MLKRGIGFFKKTIRRCFRFLRNQYNSGTCHGHTHTHRHSRSDMTGPSESACVNAFPVRSFEDCHIAPMNRDRNAELVPRTIRPAWPKMALLSPSKVYGDWQTRQLSYTSSLAVQKRPRSKRFCPTVGHATAGEQLGHRHAFRKDKDYEALTVPVPLL